MLSAVFLMQPIGQLCAYGAGLTALRIWGSAPADIDRLWRYVIGVGAAPTVLALAFRLTMYESGRYTYEVRNNPDQARDNTNRIISGDTAPDGEIAIPNGHAGDGNIASHGPGGQFNRKEMYEYLITDGNWLYLVGTSATWLLLDFVFYGKLL
jgi:MFS transporter, PHS family, inorganic phosphate transporter